MQPKIEINYEAKASNPEQSCGDCSNFQPVPGSELDGRCFGQKVSAEGSCNLFTDKN